LVSLTEQSLVEFLNVLIRKKQQPVADAALWARKWIGTYPVLLPHRAIVEDTLNLLARYKLSVWDARLVAVCNAHGCEYLLSEDLQDGARYGGLTVVNPFDRANTHLLGRLLT
jgi:predicted nucleic acid-binding protein